MSDHPYTPIACHIYDQLEIAAMKRRVVDLLVREENGEEGTRKGFIDILWARGGVEYLRLNSGETLRLDQILRLDGDLLAGEEGLLGSCGCR